MQKEIEFATGIAAQKWGQSWLSVSAAKFQESDLKPSAFPIKKQRAYL
jgi:hypothetical protein